MKRPNPAQLAAQQIDRWNRAVPVGAAVHHYDDTATEPETRTTRTPASAIGGQIPVVYLVGVTGCVTLASCMPIATVPAQEPAHAD